MAITNYNKKCTSCGGNKWEYLKDLKIWVCRYCGAQVERHEEYDGLYTIKNVVRQVILDSAYRRMEQADRNLSECQKINSRYAGTLVAGICYRLIAAVNGSTTGHDPKALLGQLRRDYQQLTAESQNISDDESAVYEFLDSSDAWATLATVFNTLGDEQRCEYLLTLTDLSQVFSKETNKSLLRFALKKSRMELVQQILANRDNIDLQDSLNQMLTGCPDGEQKGGMIAGILTAGALQPGEESLLEDYLSGSDSPQTKAHITLAAISAGLTLHMEILLREVLSFAELPVLQELLQAVFTRRLYDGEVEMLMQFAAAQKAPERCLAVLDAMISSQQFISLNVRQAQEFLCNTQLPIQSRTEILQRLKGFTSGDRLWETVAGDYLCNGKDSPEDRTNLLQKICADIASIPARDFEKYVMKCALDGEEKADRIRFVFSLPGMNIGFFRELAGNYLQKGMDLPSIRTTVLHQLLDSGISIDGATLMDYVCYSSDAPDSKVELVQLAAKNGTALRADALSSYLEVCAGNFSPELFALLYSDSCSVTQKAIENYVLLCQDSPAVKAKNACVLASRMGIPLGSTLCQIRHNGTKLNCLLAHAYLLTTKEPVNVASAMLQTMVDAGTRLNTDIQVDGKAKKFSKYVTENKASLSDVAQQLCQEHRLFARFFGF